MTLVTQSRTGSSGTCFRAALASILNLKESDVPDFPKANQDPGVNRFLAKYGLKYTQRPITEKPPTGFHTIEGTSPRGGEHAVVGKNGKFIFDPHPRDGTGRGLVKKKTWGVLMPVDQEVMPVGDQDGERKIARWESRSGKYWVDLYFNPVFKLANGNVIVDAHYRSDNGSGPVNAQTEATAIAVMQREVDRGRHQPDAAKTPLRRITDDWRTSTIGPGKLIPGDCPVCRGTGKSSVRNDKGFRLACGICKGSGFAKVSAKDSVLRPKDIKRGPGAFTVQLTDPDGHEHIEPVSSLRTYDSAQHKFEPMPGNTKPPFLCNKCLNLRSDPAHGDPKKWHHVPGKDGALSTTALLLAALWAWYRGRMDEPVSPRNWDLNTYTPRQRAFDANKKMEHITDYRGWFIEKNPHGMLFAGKKDQGEFPMVGKSVEDLKRRIDAREAQKK